MLRHSRAAPLLRSITALGCVLILAACPSSASLVRQGRFAEACRKVAGDSGANEQVFRKHVFARLAPRLSIETADANTSDELRELVSNRFEAPRFVHITFAQDLSAPFEARMTLESVRDRRAYYRAGDPADAYFAADLVTPKQEGTLANLDAFGKLFLGGTALLLSVTACATARAAPNCLGSPFSSATQEMRDRLAAVDANPKLRSRKDKVVELGKRASGLIVLLPNPSGHDDRAGVELHIALYTQFGHGSESCSYRQRAIVELKGDTYEEAIARELSGQPRPLEALHPRLE